MCLFVLLVLSEEETKSSKDCQELNHQFITGLTPQDKHPFFKTSLMASINIQTSYSHVKSGCLLVHQATNYHRNKKNINN